MIRVVVLSLLLAGCAQNAAQTAAASGGATLANASSPADKKVCRADTELGSIMNKRTCHTAGEWAAIDEQNAQNAQRALDDRQHGSAPSWQ